MIFKRLHSPRINTLKQIKVDRQSICMGDDCNAPNEEMIDVCEKDTLEDVFGKVAQYLPQMQSVIWAIDTGKRVLGFILMDEQIRYQYKFCVEMQNFLNMGVSDLHCSYFHSRSFILKTQEDDRIIEQYPWCKTMLEKVKCHMHEKFLEELKLEGGSLCIWGESFGRPNDNYHIVKTVQWKRNEIILHFEEGESLYIQNPTVIRNEKDIFSVENASEILWVWYAYGKAKSYEHLYVQRYRKNQEGSILRAKGRRKDVNEQDGEVFEPLSKRALIIQGRVV